MAARNRPSPREFDVLKSQALSQNMHRVTIGGTAMENFPPDQIGGYVKLFLPSLENETKPAVRTYTIRHQRANALDIDFALHGQAGQSNGPATRWALSAKPGDKIMIGGPGPAKPLPPGFDSYLIFGDMTALPAIGANLERLDRSASGTAFIEVCSEDDKQDIQCPDGVDINWVINPMPGMKSVLTDKLEAVDWSKLGRVYVWAACEFTTMRGLRAILGEKVGLGRDRVYISSYWKHGLNEDNHKVAKRTDAMSLTA